MPDAIHPPAIPPESATDTDPDNGREARKRPKPGERKVQILQALAISGVTSRAGR